jgi:hypothetical protein
MHLSSDLACIHLERTKSRLSTASQKSGARLQTPTPTRVSRAEKEKEPQKGQRRGLVEAFRHGLQEIRIVLKRSSNMQPVLKEVIFLPQIF